MSFLLASAVALDVALAAMRAAFDSGAGWRMERTFAGSTRPLVSTGTVECVAGESIKWTVLHPFHSSVVMTPDSMTFSDEDGIRVKTVDEMPHYEELRRCVDAFASGDLSAVDGLFDVEARQTSSAGGWTVVLTPEVRAMRRLFRSIELSGDAMPTNAVMKTGDGGVSVISFTK